jgi:hypothetical protein
MSRPNAGQGRSLEALLILRRQLIRGKRHISRPPKLFGPPVRHHEFFPACLPSASIHGHLFQPELSDYINNRPGVLLVAE